MLERRAHSNEKYVTFAINENKKESDMKILTKLSMYLIVLVGLYSCNSDIFIDDFRSPVSTISLDGNGDASTIHFASSNWDLLEIVPYGSNSSACQFKVYDADNNRVPGSNVQMLTGLGRVEAKSRLTDFVIERVSGKEVQIKVGENATLSTYSFVLRASNIYEYQEILVNISPSDRYVFDHITYSLNASIENPFEPSFSINLANHGDVSVSFPLDLYQRASHIVTFDSDDSLAFQLLQPENLFVDIPSLDGGHIEMRGLKALYKKGEQRLSLPDSPTDVRMIPMPPQTTNLISVFLEYNSFKVNYTLFAINPKSKKQRTVTGTIESLMPIKAYWIREK